MTISRRSTPTDNITGGCINWMLRHYREVSAVRGSDSGDLPAALDIGDGENLDPNQLNEN
ncbi:hypothetical protein RND71_042662 [Anisodus tanguticus]|uniref:Uncharacterized protein n=1 Tax=Anisodus tanguticus TaxID=243964 RepID=A0AAE1QRC3_9SOLA|nr:hypothetical protein RND71_042662 [Anisodus tanguticus]